MFITDSMRFITFHTVVSRWAFGIVLLVNAPSTAQIDDPAQNWLSPPDRLARRSQPGEPLSRRAADAARDAWWNEDVQANPDFARPHQARPRSRGDLIRSSQIIASVGDEPILAGDLLGRINEALQERVGRIPEDVLEEQRWALLAQLLPSAIEAKIVYLDFLRTVPAEQAEAIRASVYEQFDDKQLPELIKKAQVANVVELEEKMRAVGGSLDKTRRLFFEQAAAREMIRRRCADQDDVTHAELLDYYQRHLEEFKIEGRVRWQELTTRVAPEASEEQKAKAYRKLAQMGNAVIGGAPLDVVARRESEGFNADNGGLHDWTAQGSLVSDVLDRALFTLPVGYLSDVLADETGFHIVRVVERVEPGYVPFVEAQKRVREAIENERREAAIQEYIEELKSKTYVRSFLSQPGTGAEPTASNGA
jgi:parvulin-like peptidyl-prolyl isomerase